MPRHADSGRDVRIRQYLPTIEGLESRVVLSTSSQQAAIVAQVRHEATAFASEVKGLELKSQATPQQFQALRDDARAISLAASATNAASGLVSGQALAVTLQLDRSPLYGSLQASGWNTVTTRVTTTLQSLGASQPLIDQTIADMKAIAASAGVSSDDFATFTRDFNTLRDGISYLNRNIQYNSGYYHIEDPALFYTQHLRGFFRDWAAQKNVADASMSASLRSALAALGSNHSAQATLRRDVASLEGLGAVVPSASNRQIDQAYLQAVTQSVPSSAELAQFRSTLLNILGPAASGTRLVQVDQLVADASTTASAMQQSTSVLTSLVNAIGIDVDAGRGESLDPFKIVLYPPAAGPANA
jgi:hypothetical protein